MATQWERKWQLNADHAIMGNSGVSRFKIEKRGALGLKCFKITFKAHEMNPLWHGCVLLQRGSKPMEWKGSLLPPWVRDGNGNFPAREYRERIDANLECTTASTLRLDGEVSDRGVHSWVMFMLALGAVERPGKKPADLLIVQHGDKFDWSRPEYCGPIEDGTGHGNSP